MGYLELSKQELEKEYGNLAKRFEEIKGMGLNLNMARGKPSKEQLDFSLPMLDTINSKSDFIGEDKMDCRNYGLLNGITECRKLFADILGVDAENVIVGGSSSLNMMFDTISCFMTAPAVEGCKPWYEVKNRKFLCPVPVMTVISALLSITALSLFRFRWTTTVPIWIWLKDSFLRMTQSRVFGAFRNIQTLPASHTAMRLLSVLPL